MKVFCQEENENNFHLWYAFGPATVFLRRKRELTPFAESLVLAFNFLCMIFQGGGVTVLDRFATGGLFSL
ncbi:MAG: hypothetical protein GWN87_02940, partial [Desulfuromonadales bacterium]|nr:hypothetical protein [Desulfuromonadales bacterium]NIS39609.1 hypothetical protein [Desulfuromonadales bacterium]